MFNKRTIPFIILREHVVNGEAITHLEKAIRPATSLRRLRPHRLARFVLLISLLGLSAAGCVTMDDRYEMTLNRNTIDSYESFLKDFPDGQYTQEMRNRLQTLKEGEGFKNASVINSKNAYLTFIKQFPTPLTDYVSKARKILEDEDVAFRWTCRIGKVQALHGYLESYPESKYDSLIKYRIEFITLINPVGDIASFKRFISGHPENPFVYEAKAAVPILLLSELKEKKIGIVLDIDNFISWKGVFGGGKVTKDEVHDKVFNGYKKQLADAGVEAVILDGKDDGKESDVPAVLLIRYREYKAGSKPPYGPSPRQNGYVVDTLNQATTEMLADFFDTVLFGGDINAAYAITLKDNKTGAEYYSNIISLNEMVAMPQTSLALVFFGSDAIPSLIFNLNSEHESVRELAAKSLGMIKDQRALDSLIAALNDERYSVRKAAVEALKMILGDSVVNALITALKDKNSDVRTEAAKAIGEIKDSKAVESLIAALKDESWYVRKESAEALGKIKDPRAVESLIATLKDKNSDVQESAIKALEEIDPTWRKQEIVASLISNLVTALKDKDILVRMSAIKRLGEIKDSSAVEPLIAALKDENVGVQESAIRALGEIKDPRAVEPLTVFLKDKDPFVRSTASNALKKIKGQDFYRAPR
jgi:HEAT repeat protein